MKRANVFIDTSALPQNPNHLGPAYDRLVALSGLRVVKVHISYVVVHELASIYAENLSKYVDEAKKYLRKITKQDWTKDFINHKALISYNDYLDEIAENLKVNIDSKVSEVLSSLGADIYGVDKTHGHLVVQSYFDGTDPFKKIKRKDDFPDAFIYQCASDLSQIAGELHCIVSDNALRSALSRLDNVVVYNNIYEFVMSPMVEEKILAIEKEKAWKDTFSDIKPLLSEHEDELKSYVQFSIINELAGKTVSHEQIIDDNNEGLITSVDEPSNISFYWEDVTEIGPGTALIPFSLDSNAYIEFPVYRGDAYDVPAGVSVSYQDPERYSYFDAEGEINLSAEGQLAITFPNQIDNDEGLLNVEYYSIDDVEVTSIQEDPRGRIFILSGSNHLDN